MWKLIDKKTPKTTIIWVGGYHAGRWCFYLLTEVEETCLKYVTHWAECNAPPPPEST